MISAYLQLNLAQRQRAARIAAEFPVTIEYVSEMLLELSPEVTMKLLAKQSLKGYYPSVGEMVSIAKVVE